MHSVTAQPSAMATSSAGTQQSPGNTSTAPAQQACHHAALLPSAVPSALAATALPCLLPALRAGCCCASQANPSADLTQHPSPPSPHLLTAHATQVHALSPVLAYHAWLCDRAPELRSAPPAELAAWAAAMNRVLSLLTEPFVNRVKGIADGGAVGGPAAAFE